jgi:hypothetical protein
MEVELEERRRDRRCEKRKESRSIRAAASLASEHKRSVQLVVSKAVASHVDPHPLDLLHVQCFLPPSVEVYK